MVAPCAGEVSISFQVCNPLGWLCLKTVHDICDAGIECVRRTQIPGECDHARDHGLGQTGQTRLVRLERLHT